MSKTQVLLVVLGVVIGAVTTALLFDSGARAQTGYSVCGYLSMPNASNGADLAGRPPEHPIRIPAGWTPVGGANHRAGLPGVVVCR